MNSQLPRRSMSQALQTPDLPPEALALIREGTAQSLATRRPLETAIEPDSTTSTTKLKSATNTEEIESVEDSTPKEKPLTDRVTRARSVKEREPEPGIGGTVSRSFRLPGDLPTALLRAATERKIARVRPYTQEEIVTEALTQWLKKNDYLP